MKTRKTQGVNYGNWVPGKMIIVPGVLGVIFLGLGLLHWSFLIAAAVFLGVGAYFYTARHLFSPIGGNIQDKIQDLVIQHIEWHGKGKVLDIGCGNGPLSIKLAQRFPEAEITGMDFWGQNWDYSIKMCEENARLSGVEDRVSFRKGSASSLPFEDACFDMIVSNLVFHEVKDVNDKRISIREAMRVLKPGGVFVLQDLFLLHPYYGTPGELIKTIKGWGVGEVEFIRTCDEAIIPGFVKLPFMVGTLAILRGIK
ncbi:MAG: class I SAM-dependent methyltransferase [Anaerolineaceae bacterium]